MKKLFLFFLLISFSCKSNYNIDNDPNVLHWEIIDDSLYIYTKQDSINDEIERWRYKDSIYKIDSHDKWENK